MKAILDPFVTGSHFLVTGCLGKWKSHTEMIIFST